MKIISNDYFERMKWDWSCDENDSNCSSDSNWADATLQTYLNGEYYNSLSEKTKNMIEESTWYLNSPSNGATGPGIYISERMTGQNFHESSHINRNIGLPYMSDYLFSPIDECTSVGVYGFSCSGCFPDDAWISFSISQASDKQVFSLGGVLDLDGYPYLASAYLSSYVEIVEGNGSIEQPYQLSI